MRARGCCQSVEAHFLLATGKGDGCCWTCVPWSEAGAGAVSVSWWVAVGHGSWAGAGGRGRYYLGDRLLVQGLSWLEEAIVEQIGLCFPSRFPQEMLRNWAESEELQQQFYLFQLQEKDKRLLELDTGLDEASVLVG